MTSKDDEKESEVEEICRITPQNKILPNNSRKKSTREETKIHYRYRLSGHHHAKYSSTLRNEEHQTNERKKPRCEQRRNQSPVENMGGSRIQLYNYKKVKLPLLITKEDDITPLLRVNWLKQLSITINKISLHRETNQSETIYTKFRKIFATNHTINSTEVKIQLKPRCYVTTSSHHCRRNHKS